MEEETIVFPWQGVIETKKEWERIDSINSFDVEDVEALVTRGAQYGAKLMGEVLEITSGPNKGGRAVYMRDPDGVTMEFIQRRTG